MTPKSKTPSFVWVAATVLLGCGSATTKLGPGHAACLGGDVEACASWGAQRASDDGVELGMGLAALQYACEAGHSASCARLAEHGLGASLPAEQLEESIDTACNEGDGAACVALANRASAPRREALLERGCEAGAGEACHAMAGELRRRWRLGDYLLRAQKLDERACELGSMDGCIAAGQALVFGSGVESNPEAGLELLANACDDGAAKACEVLATLYEDGIGVSSDLRRAAGLRERAAKSEDGVLRRAAPLVLFAAACANGDALGCWAARGLRAEGEGRNTAISAAFADVACRLGLSTACTDEPGDLPQQGRRGALKKGWPKRPSDRQFRCPEGTSLQDELHGSGRRSVRCVLPGTALPRGFALEWHANGVLASLTQFDGDGLPKEETRWYESGRDSSVAVFADGAVSSKTAWYENGKPKYETVLHTETQIRHVTRYGPDGDLEEQGAEKDGKKVGEWTEYREGASEHCRYEGGLLHGQVHRTYPGGDTETGAYDHGAKVGVWKRVDHNGNPVVEEIWQAGVRHGLARSWHPNGQLRSRGVWSRGQRNGLWKTWFPSGTPQSKQGWTCGTKHGPTVTYFPSGTIQSSAAYDHGREAGEWRTYSDDGTVLRITQHDALPEGFQAPGEDDLPECAPSTTR